ncbi:hypothetical protein GCM10009092_35130 [Bowmanella denitrificans]|uniref:Uncharacterized protein n=1 Tax=Bowmanella denitrificans TaxID=366582 RepID=A0ABN0XM64_9ALTE
MTIYSDPAEEVSTRYFREINRVAGPLSISVGIGVLTMDGRPIIAWITYVLIMFWCMSEGGEYRRILKSRPNYPTPWNRILSQCLLLNAGMLLLALIAVELV